VAPDNRLALLSNVSEKPTSVRLENAFTSILQAVGEDLGREGLCKTPARAAKAFQFMTGGYKESPHDVVKDALFECEAEELVIVRDIDLFSLCEHHLLPFFGKCQVAYLPTGKVVGLSKVARIVDLYSRRLQNQEALSQQIAEAVFEVTEARGVGVVMQTKHMCMMARGVQKQNASMSTIVTLGEIKTNSSVRREFLHLAGTNGI